MRALITEEFHPLLLDGLKKMGIDFDLSYDINTIGVQKIISEYDILIVNSKILIDEELLNKAENLKIIGRVGSGLEIINVSVCDERGIAVVNSPEGNRLAVAEHALGLLLTMMNRIVIANDQLKNGNWVREGNRGEELSNKTVAIIGYGHTGSSFANLLSGFDINILAVDPNIKIPTNSKIKQSTLNEVFEFADVVSLHLPLNLNTLHFANDDFFRKFKKNIWFINTSRGKVCDSVALIHYLEIGKIKGAGLDVFENENITSLNDDEQLIWNKLTQFSNVIRTPHIAGWTFESKEKLATVLLHKIKNQVEKLGI